MKTKTKREARIPSVPSLALSVREDLKYSGLGVSAGIAIGPAHVMEQGLIDVTEYIVTDVE